MGAGASALPASLDRQTAQAIAGDRFDAEAFDAAAALDGTVTREDFIAAANNNIAQPQEPAVNISTPRATDDSPPTTQDDPPHVPPARSVGVEKKEAVAIDLARYTQPESIWQALMTGHVRLVKMTWLIKSSKSGKILARRQELPEEAFISVEELKMMFGDGNSDGVLPIIAISFCWLTPAHPDPEGKQLAIVAAKLEQEQRKYGSFGFAEMGLFWDWLSMYQMVCDEMI